MDTIYNYYYKLTRNQKKLFIQICCKTCDFSYPTFMTKMRKRSWSKLEREAIKKIIQKEQHHANTD